jgi:type 1 glutamine amidotransferase
MFRFRSVAALLVIGWAVHCPSSAVAEDHPQVLIVVGPSSHPPGSHEVAAGGRVMEYCIENMQNADSLRASVVTTWPRDLELLADVETVVFIGDTFPPQRMDGTKAILASLDQMMSHGCGIVCVHYATGLRGEDVAGDGDHPLLHWLGGYFANRTCPHHESIARIYPAANITPDAPDHPISHGWKSFTINDEPYINNYFGKDENKLAANVTSIATSMLPPEKPRRETVAWCVERDDSGRGFGIVMPHFYKNWRNPELRRLILNGIVWSAGREVPEAGVQTELPDLKSFDPVAVEFKPRRRK